MPAKKRIALLLSGCGVFDGTEIHEAVLTMLAIDRQGADYQCFAPDIDQHHVVNHLTGDEMPGPRNALVESARIARGAIKPLSSYSAREFDGMILPGGFGAAKNLSTFAFDGEECKVQPQVQDALKETHAAKKPIGALCISPAVLTRVFGSIQVTIGSDRNTIAAIEKMGGRHKQTTHAEICLDEANRIVTTPCYMLDARIGQVADGANNLVQAVLALAGRA
jgi:enhancing lycopene biosynthesis protein 2